MSNSTLEEIALKRFALKRLAQDIEFEINRRYIPLNRGWGATCVTTQVEAVPDELSKEHEAALTDLSNWYGVEQALILSGRSSFQSSDAYEIAGEAAIMVTVVLPENLGGKKIETLCRDEQFNIWVKSNPV